MRALLQRVASAAISVDTEEIARIERGLLVYVGVGPGDTHEDASAIARKIRHLRIFPDDAGKMNLDVVQARGAVLLVSNFTLYADLAHGRRPAFTGAAPPDAAEALYLLLAAQLRELGLSVSLGRFGAHMVIRSDADGPVNLWLDSRAQEPRPG